MAENTVQKTNGATAVEATPTEATRDSERVVTPPVDIYETAEGLTVVADLPGADPAGIDVNVEDNVLTLKALVPATAAEADTYSEFRLASFFRQFTLGEKIDQQRIRAESRNGVLTLFLPFAEKAKPRRISVQAA
jgi:HSP20 family molecular chaperone IbpA